MEKIIGAKIKLVMKCFNARRYKNISASLFLIISHAKLCSKLAHSVVYACPSGLLG
jgi:hypothetical protein